MRRAWLVGPLVLACGRPAAPVPVDVRWRPFFWASVTIDSATFAGAAVVLSDPREPTPVTASMLQLDVGSSGTWPLGFPSKASVSAIPTDDIRLHGLLTNAKTIAIVRTRPDVAAPAQLLRLGTLGLQSFSTDLLFLDFKLERLGIAPNPIATIPWGTAGVVPVEYRGDYVVVRVAASGQPAFRALLDSGLSPFPLWTSPGQWSLLTGRQPDDPRNRRYEIPHPTGRLIFVGAPTRSALRVGPVSLGSVEAVVLQPTGPRVDP
jgi:hypothetical protein